MTGSFVNLYRPSYRLRRYFGDKRVKDSRILVACLALALPTAVAIAQDDSAGHFDLTVGSQDRISLTADNASLETIVSQLGEDLGIEVTGTLSEDRRVTAQFADVSVAEALREIGDSYVLISDAADGEAQKIVLLGKGQDGHIADNPQNDRPADTASEASQGGFQFEFDPSQAPIHDPDSEKSDSGRDR